jgi:hypothetical protein
MGEVRGAYNILIGRPEGRRPLGRPRCRWADNIKMDLREIGFGDVNWIHWAQDRDRWRALVNMFHVLVPLEFGSVRSKSGHAKEPKEFLMTCCSLYVQTCTCRVFTGLAYSQYDLRGLV